MGTAGYADGVGRTAKLSEPGGLALGPNGSLFVADTNNSAIRILTPMTGRLQTVELSGVPPPRVSPLDAPVSMDMPPPGRVWGRQVS